jgi:hypothetical protein
MGTGAGAPMYPMELAVCHRISIADGRVDPVGRPIHPLRKVFFDWFSSNLPQSEARFACSSSALSARVASSFNDVHGELEGDSPESLGRIVDILFVGLEKRNNRNPNLNPDAWQRDAVNWYDESHGKAILQLAVVLTVLGLLSRSETRTVKGPYTAHTSNFAVSVVDGDDKKSCVELLQAYSEYAKTASIVTMGAKPNLIVLTRTSRCAMPSDHSQVVPDNIQRVSAKDTDALPEELKPKPGDILATPENQWYWHTGQSLASVLDEDGAQIAAVALRGKLGTLAPA